MKNFKKIISLLILIFIAFSCNEDNLDELGNWELTPATIELPTNNTSVILDEEAPNETVTFSWSPAKSSANYAISYAVVFDTLGSTNFDTPILEFPSGSNGKNLSLAISNKTINEYLSYSGYSTSEIANITWAVKAKCLDKVAYASSDISIQRFTTESIPVKLYVSGTATENNNDLSNAIEMKRLKNSAGQFSNIHEIYTRLTAGNSYKFFSEKALPCHQYGGSDENLVKSGDPIIVDETGEYRIMVDLDNNTYNLLKINYWSVVGQPINGAWGGDEPLEYQGYGVWKKSIQLVSAGGFVFRANGDWAYLLKKVIGSSNEVIMESQAASQGLTFEDLNSTQIGNYFITLNLSATGYSYSMELDNTPPASIPTPQQLFLLANGSVIEEFNKSGDIFSLNKFIPMQSTVSYTLNSQSDGLGTSYSINNLLGESNTPDGDKVTGSNVLTTNSTVINLQSDRALKFSINFGQAKLNWEYYNFKLFHWQNWDTRNEFVMTYQHPNKYAITTNLSANYDMKFISPWDFDLGSSSPSSLTGDLINGGGSNINNITNNGNYKVTITLDDDYLSGTYTYVLQ